MQTDPARILVVDDTETNRDMLSRRLERRGHQVAIAENGLQALDALQRAAAGGTPFDLVLLDVMMPGIDGMETLARIRRMHDAMALPVIMATAKDAAEDIVKAFELGATDYVTKPLEFSVVLARVNTALSLKRSVDRVRGLEKDLAAKNAQLERANARMVSELQLAAAVQRALLPAASPEVEGVEFAWVYRPCDELAGDIFNVIPLDEDHVGLYLLDVSGHGVPAALLSVTLARLLTPIPGEASVVQQFSPGVRRLVPTPPERVAAELNRRFQMDQANTQYFTLMYGVLDTKAGELRLVSAGHPPPVHVPMSGADGDTRLLDCRNFAVGWLEDIPFEPHTLRLGAGDRFYVYSDGVAEAADASGELFGHERVRSSLHLGRGLSLPESLHSLVEEAGRWSGRKFRDDVSALAFQLAPK